MLTMSAVVLTPDRQIVVDSMRAPALVPDQVIVEIELCGICGTDLHSPHLAEVYTGGFALGHETFGRISAVGDEVRGWAVGQRVSVNPIGNVCGVCEWCRTGRVNFCVQATRETVVGLQRDGGLAPQLATYPGTLRAIPDSMGRIEAAWIEPAATALHAIQLAGSIEGKTVLVTGGGPIGQLVCRLLKLKHPGTIVLVEPAPQRRAFGAVSGAHLILDPTEAAAALAGLRIDVVIECSGNREATRQGIDNLTPGGTLVVVGVGEGSGLDPLQILQKELVIRGSFTYTDEFDAVIPLLADGSLPVADLTTAIVPLTEALDAFARLREAQTMKVLIDPHL